MITIFHQLPHLEAYGNPQYFFYLILAVLPIFIGLFFKRRFPIYEALVSLVFIILMLTGKDLNQIISLLAYVVWQVVLVLLTSFIVKNTITNGSFISVSFGYFPFSLDQSHTFNDY